MSFEARQLLQYVLPHIRINERSDNVGFTKLLCSFSRKGLFFKSHLVVILQR